MVNILKVSSHTASDRPKSWYLVFEWHDKRADFICQSYEFDGIHRYEMCVLERSDNDFFPSNRVGKYARVYITSASAHIEFYDGVGMEIHPDKVEF